MIGDVSAHLRDYLRSLPSGDLDPNLRILLNQSTTYSPRQSADLSHRLKTLPGSPRSPLLPRTLFDSSRLTPESSERLWLPESHLDFGTASYSGSPSRLGVSSRTYSGSPAPSQTPYDLRMGTAPRSSDQSIDWQHLASGSSVMFLGTRKSSARHLVPNLGDNLSDSQGRPRSSSATTPDELSPSKRRCAQRHSEGCTVSLPESSDSILSRGSPNLQIIQQQPEDSTSWLGHHETAGSSSAIQSSNERFGHHSSLAGGGRKLSTQLWVALSEPRIRDTPLDRPNGSADGSGSAIPSSNGDDSSSTFYVQEGPVRSHSTCNAESRLSRIDSRDTPVSCTEIATRRFDTAPSLEHRSIRRRKQVRFDRCRSQGDHDKVSFERLSSRVLQMLEESETPAKIEAKPSSKTHLWNDVLKPFLSSLSFSMGETSEDESRITRSLSCGVRADQLNQSTRDLSPEILLKRGSSTFRDSLMNSLQRCQSYSPMRRERPQESCTVEHRMLLFPGNTIVPTITVR